MGRPTKKTADGLAPQVPPRAPAGHHSECACALCTKARRARAPLAPISTSTPKTAPARAPAPQPTEPASAPETSGRRARQCRLCGCDDAWGCDGGCSWIEPDLCSACVRELDGAVLEQALDVAADELVDALIHAPDDAEKDAVARALEKVLAGFGIRRRGAQS